MSDAGPVSRLRKIALADVPSVLWRNGGGHTRELIAWPDAAAWTLRLSVALVERDGPFSAWPGVVREFALLDGAGVVLRWPDGRAVALHAGDGALRFDGADAPHAHLVGGTTRDLNLMTRDDTRARLIRNDGSMQRRPWGCLATDDAELEADGRVLAVPAWSLLWLNEAAVDRACLRGVGWWIERSDAPAAS
jgi:uncharacterized protein